MMAPVLRVSLNANLTLCQRFASGCLQVCNTASVVLSWSSERDGTCDMYYMADAKPVGCTCLLICPVPKIGYLV